LRKTSDNSSGAQTILLLLSPLLLSPLLLSPLLLSPVLFGPVLFGLLDIVTTIRGMFGTRRHGGNRGGDQEGSIAGEHLPLASAYTEFGILW
jgi:hypothetical protein